ncbi:MAG: regulatory protein RecX [Armatimonadota bacterium]|nr:regulatory protein RecX [Armatimonadota bacterium]
MDVITAIEIQQRRGNRRSIFVNGRFVAGVDEEVVLALGLRVGQQVSEDRLAQMLHTETVQRARQVALNLLGYRPRSRQELTRRLLLKGYPDDVVEEALTALADVDLINDEKFSKDWVASRLEQRPMGKVRIAWELRQKGIPPELVEEAVEAVDSETEYELALGLAQRKIKHIGAEASDEERRRLASFLRRRGFSWDVTNRVVGEVMPADD